MKGKRYFRVCPYCKANLDPNEKCDCQRQPSEKPMNAKGLVFVTACAIKRGVTRQ